MAGQRGGLLLSLLLLSLAMPDLTFDMTVTVSPALRTSLTPAETELLPPITNSTTTATFYPSSPETSSPETSTPEVLTDAFPDSTAMPQGSSPEASSITTLWVRGSTAHSSLESPAGTTAQSDPNPTGLEDTTGTPTPASTAMTPSCAEATMATSLGTSRVPAPSSFGVERSTLPPTTAASLYSPWVSTTLGTSAHQEPAVTTPLGSTSPGTGSASSPTAPAPTATVDEPSTVPSDSPETPVTGTVIPGSNSSPGSPAGTSPGSATPAAAETARTAAEITAMDETSTMSLTQPTSMTPMATLALLPTSASTTADTIPPSSPETEAPTLETFSTSPGTESTSPLATPPPTASAPTTASADPLATLSDTMATPDDSTRIPGITSDPSQPAGTTARTTSGISTLTGGPTTLETLTTLETTNAATGMEASSPDIDSTQTPKVTFSIPADVSTMPPVCPSTTSNTSASHLFLLMHLTIPMDLENTVVQELVLSKIRADLQRMFPHAGLSLKWRGQRKT